MSQLRIWLAAACLILLTAGCGPGVETERGQTPTLEAADQATTSITAAPRIEISPPPIKQIPTESSVKTATPVSCREPEGIMRGFRFQSTWNDELLSGKIYLPPCYQDSGKEYPVLYLIHGAESTEELWLELGLEKTANQLIRSGEIQPLIIVLPRDRGTNFPSENPFGEIVIKDLVPWIDLQYRTRAARAFRAIGGISRGGNWAVRLGLLHWGVFGSLGAHSAPLFAGDLNRLPGWLEGIPPEMIPKIYLDVGEGDQDLDRILALEGSLADAGVSYEYHRNPGLHEEDYWKAHLADYLIWYSAQLKNGP